MMSKFSMIAVTVLALACAQAAPVSLDQGFHAQKWFLRHGPPDGEDGFRKNVAVVVGLVWPA